MKVKVSSLDGDTDYFDIIGMLQGDTLAPYLFIICLDYVLRTFIDKMKDNSFKLTKERSRRYPTQTITNADYTDDIVLLANTPAQARTLLHSPERAATSIGLHVNTNKMEYVCFNQRGDISTLNKIKCSFFQAVVVSILLYRCTTWTLTKHMERKIDGITQECCE